MVVVTETEERDFRKSLGVRAGGNGKRWFATLDEADQFRDALFQEYPPEGYGTSATAMKERGGWTVFFYVGNAD